MKNELVPKSQQRFTGAGYNVFSEEVNKIALTTNYDKIIQSIDSIETYAYGTSKNLVCKMKKFDIRI